MATFFLDDRGPATDIWSTMVVFGKEDSCTVCGVTEKGFTIDAYLYVYGAI